MDTAHDLSLIKLMKGAGWRIAIIVIEDSEGLYLAIRRLGRGRRRIWCMMCSLVLEDDSTQSLSLLISSLI